MTDGEIRQVYRSARNRKKQISAPWNAAACLQNRRRL